MKLPVRILLGLLCAALVLAAPFALSAPNMLEDAQWELIDILDADESGLLSFLIPSAAAEVVEEESTYSLPVDKSAGMQPNPALFTEDGYEDASIRVQLETREGDKDVIWRIAWIEIASPTQLRTAYFGKNVKSDKTDYISRLAPKMNAVIAINGDNYGQEKAKHSFVVRMGEVRQKKLNKLKDILIIDENGDFHIFLNSAGADTFEKDTGHTIVNAFMFGPALVKEGEAVSLKREYDFNPNGRQPRVAIGQLDRLSYVIVVADNAKGLNTVGVTHQELAQFMHELGCQQAYNLDGGNSSIMLYNGKMVNNKVGQERDVTDMIYFATAVPPEEWEQ
ncbi:MAG: phosphodiester glycosidase family protein [Clostridia bacterium]|nr:phosphodiester glycosidase family protein [Clostridia bacterium]